MADRRAGPDAMSSGLSPRDCGQGDASLVSPVLSSQKKNREAPWGVDLTVCR